MSDKSGRAVTEPGDQPEAEIVIMLDLRTSATGPDAIDAKDIDERTLEERQRRSYPSDAVDAAPGWRMVNFERLLVIDDAETFAEHDGGYRYLIEAPTFGRMLCLVIGAPPDPPYLDVPKATTEAPKVPIIWVGDARGVGWQIGRANTTRLAFSDTDPDGSEAIANLIEALQSPPVFDEFAEAVDDLPGRAGVPALLPWALWPRVMVEVVPAEVSTPEIVVPDAVADPRPVGCWPWLVAAALFVIGCGVLTGTALLITRHSRLNGDYVVAGAGAVALGLLVLLIIACRRLVGRLTDAAPPAPSPPPKVTRPVSIEPPSPEVLIQVEWMMTASAADEAFRQLTTPEHLVMLNGDPDLAKVVRFAPESARPQIGRFADGESVCWTPEGECLGVVRLVPMKEGLIRQWGGVADGQPVKRDPVSAVAELGEEA